MEEEGVAQQRCRKQEWVGVDTGGEEEERKLL